MNIIKYQVPSVLPKIKSPRFPLSLRIYQSPHPIPRIPTLRCFWVPSFFLHRCVTVCTRTDRPPSEEKIIRLLHLSAEDAMLPRAVVSRANTEFEPLQAVTNAIGHPTAGTAVPSTAKGTNKRFWSRSSLPLSS